MRASCKPQGSVNQLSLASDPNVADVKIQERCIGCTGSDAIPSASSALPEGTLSKRVFTASAMSSGDSTSRNCVPTSTHRTAVPLQAAAKRALRSASSTARSCRRPKSGAISLTVSSARMASSHAVCTVCNAPDHSAPSTPSGLPSVQRSLAPGHDWPTTSRRSRAARSRSEATCIQSTKPRASCRPVANTSRAKSSNWPVVSWVPRNCTPVSFSWWASSNTTTRTEGKSSATPDSRTAKSAKKRWWLTTTTSAASASLRATLTWQALNCGHCAPRQFSRVEVTSGTSGERSSRSGNSARSPVRVACDQTSMAARVPKAARPSTPPSCRASASRCKQR